MGMVLMRLVYMLYFLGAGLVIWQAISNILFSTKKWKEKGCLFFTSMCFSIVWPLAFFSKAGRKKLGKFYNFK